MQSPQLNNYYFIVTLHVFSSGQLEQFMKGQTDAMQDDDNIEDSDPTVSSEPSIPPEETTPNGELLIFITFFLVLFYYELCS